MKDALDFKGLGILGIAGFISSFAEGGWQRKVAITAGITAALYVLYVLWLFAKAMYARIRITTRESANGYLLVALKGCFDGLHTAYANDGKIDDEEFVEILQSFCEALHLFYIYKTSAAVGVSIKLFKPGGSGALYTPA